MQHDDKQEIKFKGRPINFLFKKDVKQGISSYQIVRFEEIEHLSGPAFSAGVPNIDDGKTTIILKGEMPLMASRGEYIVRCCKESNNSSHAWHEDAFRVIDIRADCDFSNPVDVKKFCLFIMTERQRDALLAVYPNPIPLLKSKDIKALGRVKGFGPIVSEKICDSYDQASGCEMAYIHLSQYGLTKNAIDYLVRWYHSPDIALEAVESNPYNLLLVPGYGWIKADTIALREGVQRNDPRRILAYAEHLLRNLGEMAGDSWVVLQDLFDAICKDCSPIDPNIMCQTIQQATIPECDFEKQYGDFTNKNGICKIQDFGDKCFCYDENGSKIGLLETRLTEREVKTQLERLRDAHTNFSYNKEECLSIIHECEQEQHFSYTKEQYTAIWTILDNNVVVLTGRAGCGKSTVLNAIAKIFFHFDIPMGQCALSGRASANLTDITGIEGKTIHRLLGYQPSKGFKYSSSKKLPLSLVILDETSMVGGPLFLDLISAISTGSKFVMVGDVAQLDPIGGSAIFKDCIRSRFVPIVELTEIHRQAAASGIILESLKISDGKAIVKNDAQGVTVRGDLRDFRLVAVQDMSLILETTIAEYERLVSELHIDPHKIQIVTPLKARGDLSCLSLNSRIQLYLHTKSGVSVQDPHITVEVQASSYKTVQQKIYVGDRVLVTKNNYNVTTIGGDTTQIFNGNIGYVVSVPKADDDYTIINFAEQGSVCLAESELPSIQLAYAATVHKFQGTGIDYVIFAFDSCAYLLGSRELIYTALTRAKKMCVLVCNPKLLNIFARTSKIKEKRTWLSSDLQQASSDKAMETLFGKEQK
jgi:exodeoxyribonuclease V alpha subunit